MLKTNCKAALENIRAYILNRTNVDNYEGLEQPKTFKEASQIIIDCFYSEYMHGYNLKRNRQDCFTDWLSGLPSIFDSADYYYTRNAVDVLGELLEETEEEKKRFNNLKAEKLLSYLIYREVTKATGRYW